MTERSGTESSSLRHVTTSMEHTWTGVLPGRLALRTGGRVQVLKEAGNDRFEQRRHSEAVAGNQKEADFFKCTPLNAGARAMLAALYCNSA